MTYYMAQVGSATFGLNTPESDVDIGMVTTDFSGPVHDGNKHYIRVWPGQFCDALLRLDHVQWLQWLYPARVIEAGELGAWISANGERLIAANRASVYDAYMRMARRLRARAPSYYPAATKMMVYSTLHYDTIARYAAGIPFAKAIRPDEDMRQLLLAMRRRELLLDEALAVNDDARARAEAAAEMRNAPADDEYLRQCGRKLSEILGLETDT